MQGARPNSSADRSEMGQIDRSRRRRGCAGALRHKICTASLDNAPLIDGFVRAPPKVDRKHPGSVFPLCFDDPARDADTDRRGALNRQPNWQRSTAARNERLIPILHHDRRLCRDSREILADAIVTTGHGPSWPAQDHPAATGQDGLATWRLKANIFIPPRHIVKLNAIRPLSTILLYPAGRHNNQKRPLQLPVSNLRNLN